MSQGEIYNYRILHFEDKHTNTHERQHLQTLIVIMKQTCIQAFQKSTGIINGDFSYHVDKQYKYE